MAGLPAPRFLGIAFATCFLLLAAIAAFNWHANPGGLFQQGGGQRPEVVLGRVLASGWNVATATSIDERSLRPAQILGGPPNRGTLVFGSSRVMEIRPDVVAVSGDFLSNWVGSATLEDDLALLEIHLEHGAKPKRIILGVDPWIFNAGGPADPRSGTFAGPLARMSARMKLPLGWEHMAPPPADGSSASGERESLDIRLRRYAQLISWGYLSQSLGSLFQKGSASEKVIDWVRYRTTHDDWNDTRTYRVDGSMGYDRKYRERTAAEIDADALQYATPPVFKLDGFMKVDRARGEVLGAFLDYLRVSGVEVEIYLPPYHPTTYAALMKLPLGPLIREAEQRAREIASQRRVPIVGSYDPQIAGCVAADFYDGMHLRKEAVVRVFTAPARP